MARPRELKGGSQRGSTEVRSGATPAVRRTENPRVAGSIRVLATVAFGRCQSESGLGPEQRYCSSQATIESPAGKTSRCSPAAGPEGGIGPPFSLS